VLHQGRFALSIDAFLLLSVTVACLVAPETALAFGKRKVTPPPAPTIPMTPVREHGELRLHVMTYNVHGLPNPFANMSHFRKIGERLAERRRQGTAPHIVAIQEGFHRDVQDLIDAAGYPYKKDGPGPDTPRVGSGLIILSEFPLSGLRSMAFALENSAGWDWNARKGIMSVLVRLPGLPTALRLFNTHLQADYSSDPFAPVRETRAARKRQLAELRDFFGRISISGEASIFAGDFNTNASLDDYYDIIAFTGLMNTSEQCWISNECLGNANVKNDLYGSVDHQFYRTDSVVEMKPIRYDKTFSEPVHNGKPLSDHDALEVEYQVRW